MKNSLLPLLLFCIVSGTFANAKAIDYKFDGSISEPVLRNYLQHAVTHVGLCATSPEPSTASFEDDMRMLTYIGAKFVGRAAYAWNIPDDDDAHFLNAMQAATKVHKADTEIVLQACIFEAVYSGVDRIAVPDWVFSEFGLIPEKRKFNYRAMLFNGNHYHNHWKMGASIPDITKLETRMWFFYRARRYIDAGFEAIHFGQIHLTGEQDPQFKNWYNLLSRVRGYARQKARRHFVLCDAHTHGAYSVGNRLLFDFHAWPCRPKEVLSRPQHVEFVSDYGDTIVGHSKGGITPSGWQCDSLPYMIEVDSWNTSGHAGQGGIGMPWLWGYDEICWFAHQPNEERNAFIRAAHQWIHWIDKSGYFQMPTRRNLADATKINGQDTRMYQANNPSNSCPLGFAQEATIYSLWTKTVQHD